MLLQPESSKLVASAPVTSARLNFHDWLKFCTTRTEAGPDDPPSTAAPPEPPLTALPVPVRPPAPPPAPPLRLPPEATVPLPPPAPPLRAPPEATMPPAAFPPEPPRARPPDAWAPASARVAPAGRGASRRGGVAPPATRFLRSRLYRTSHRRLLRRFAVHADHLARRRPSQASL